MDLKLEVVGLPVRDVDTAVAFYADQVGFHVDHDIAPSEHMRVVQLTPPGSPCSAIPAPPRVFNSWWRTSTPPARSWPIGVSRSPTYSNSARKDHLARGSHSSATLTGMAGRCRRSSAADHR